jgi:hypothetical protein
MPHKPTTVIAPDLPGLLSAVLAHPDLPERIFTGIADNLLDMNLSAQVNFFTPDMIERTLVAYATHETKQPRGRRK